MSKPGITSEVTSLPVLHTVTHANIVLRFICQRFVLSFVFYCTVVVFFLNADVVALFCALDLLMCNAKELKAKRAKASLSS